jgi:hypothetical protein
MEKEFRNEIPSSPIINDGITLSHKYKRFFFIIAISERPVYILYLILFSIFSEKNLMELRRYEIE